MTSRDRAAVVGVGVAACAVCCAGPILAFLGAVGLFTVLGFVMFGVVGLFVALLAIPVVARRRRRRRRREGDGGDPAPVTVELSRARTR